MHEDFMITRHGKQYVLFAGLLDEFHRVYMNHEIDTELVQIPNDENGQVAVVKAVVKGTTKDGTEDRTFSGVGDASPHNVGRNIIPHIIRMAETRAKSRALRDAVNVGATALEELGDEDETESGRTDVGPKTDQVGERRQRKGSQSRGPKGDLSPDRALTNSQMARIADLANQKFAGGVEEMEREIEWLAGSSVDTISELSAKRLIDDLIERDDFTADEVDGVQKGGAKQAQRARKSQVDRLKALAVELRGEGGVERFEDRIGKPVEQLTRDEADEWLDALAPQEV